MQTHIRRYYRFGMLSLVLLPVLGLNKIAEEYKLKTAPAHCIEVTYPASDTIPFGEGETFYEIRKYQHFVLSADSLQNDIILNQSREALNKIKENLDTINGIHVTLNDSTKYKDYIKLIDQSCEEFPGAFASHNNDFWSFYVDIDTTGIPKDVLAKWKKQYKKMHCHQ